MKRITLIGLLLTLAITFSIAAQAQLEDFTDALADSENQPVGDESDFDLAEKLRDNGPRVRLLNQSQNVTRTRTGSGYEFTLENSSIKKIQTNTSLLNISIDEPSITRFNKSFAIQNDQNVDANLTAEASGTKLYICDQWNFENQTCNLRWKRMANITPGENYTIQVSNQSQAFSESDNPIDLVDGTDSLYSYTTQKNLRQNQTTYTLDHPFITSVRFENITGTDSKFAITETTNDTKIQNSYTLSTAGTDANSTTITLRARGKSLFTCAYWNQTGRECAGKWKKEHALNQSNTYSLSLQKGQNMAFGENNLPVDLLDKEQKLITSTQNITANNSGMLTVELEPEHSERNTSIERITIRGYDENTTTIDLRIDKTDDTDSFEKIYSIDPTQLNFTNATITVRAVGDTLSKCKDWDFSTQTCYGSWIPYKTNLTPGETYTFTLTPEDPAYGEDLSVLTVQSYPLLGGVWEVGFNTTGTQNLTIQAVEGTTLDHNGTQTDLVYISLYCGDTLITNYTNISNGIFVQDYNCTDFTSKFSARVATNGHHHILLTYGNDSDYAHNFAGVVSVQHGTTSVNVNGNVDVPITAVNTSAAFVFFSASSSGNRPVQQMIRGQILNSSTLRFTRVTNEGSPTAITVNWHVVEFARGVVVQRGTTSQTGTTLNVGISPVNVSQSFVLFSKSVASGDSTVGTDDMVIADLTSPTNLQFRVNAANSAHTIAWTVVHFTNNSDASVQRFNTTLGSSTSSTNITLPTSVNTSRTFVLTSHTISGGGTNIGAQSIRTRLVNSNTVTLDRQSTGSTIAANVQVVQLGTGTSVQRGNAAFSSGTGTVNAGITAVETQLSVPTATTQNGGGQGTGSTSYTGDDIFGASTARINFTNTTQIQLVRAFTTGTANIAWNVIRFAESVPPSITNVQPAAGSVLISGQAIQISANVTDNFGVQSVQATVTHPNGTTTPLTLTISTGSTYSANFTPAIGGQYDIIITATDTSSNTAAAETHFVIGAATELRQIITGSGTTSGTATTIDFTSGTGGVSLTDTSKAIHFVMYNHTFTEQHDATFKSSAIINRNQLRIYSPSGANSVPFNYVIFEFTNTSPITVQRTVLATQSDATFPRTQTFRDTKNNSQTMLIDTGHTHNGSDTTIGSEEYDRISLLNSSAWRYNIDTPFNSGPQDNRVTIVDWNDAAFIKNIQRGNTTLAAAANGINITPAQTINRNHTLLLVNYQTSGGAFSETPANVGVRTTINNAGNIQIDRSGTGSALTLSWQLVEFDPLAASVQHHLVNLTAGQSSSTATITPVQLNRSAAIGTVSSPFGQGTGSSASTTAGQIGSMQFGINLTSASTVRAARAVTGATASVAVQIVNIIAGLGNVTPSVIITTPPTSSTFNTSVPIQISANVTTLAGLIDTVLANVTLPNGSVDQLTLSFTNGSKYNISYFIPEVNGTYTIRVIANNSFGNLNATETRTFTALQPESSGTLLINDTTTRIPFSTGIFSGTKLFAGNITLNQTLFGSYTSAVFDSQAAGTSWINISWSASSSGPLANGGAEESGSGPTVNMSGNMALLHLDEPSGATNFTDSSGFNRTFSCGVAADCPSTTTGKIDQAQSFDGNDYIEDGDGENYINGLSAFTLTAWVKSDVTNTDNGIYLAKTPDGTDQGLGIRYDAAGASSGCTNCIKAGITTTSTLEHQIESSDNTQTTEWQHLAIRWNTGDTMELYINGVNDTGATSINPNPTGTITGSDTVLVGVGAKGTPGSSGWDGNIDEVAIWNRSLSVQEIQNVYERGAALYNISVRSCDDIACDTEIFSQLNGTSPQKLNVSNNRYIQYRFNLSSDTSTQTPELENVTIHFEVDNTPPLVFDVRPIAASTFPLSGTLQISANVTDSVGVGNVIAIVVYPNGTHQNVSLTLATGDKHNATFTVPNLTGRYNITYNASDVNGNYNDSVTSHFFATDQTAPVIIFDEILFFINATENTTLLNETNALKTDAAIITYNISDNNELDRLRLFFRNTNGSAQDTCNGFNTSIGAVGNKQHSQCFEWLEFDNTTETNTFDKDFTPTDTISLGNIGADRFQWRVEEFYRPTFKNYPFVNNSIHFNESTPVNNSFYIRQVIGNDLDIPEDADLYILQARFNFSTSITNTSSLHSYVCDSDYPDGQNFHESPNCARVGNFFQPNRNTFNLRFGGDVFDKLDSLSNMTAILHWPQSEPFYPELGLVTDASAQNLTFYADNNLFENETALYPLSSTTHLHWVFEATTCLQFFANVNDTAGNEINSSIEEICYQDFGSNFAPTKPFINEPDSNDTINGVFNITWQQGQDPDGDSFTSTLELLNPDGTPNTTIATGIPKNTEFYMFNTTTVSDGAYKLRLNHTDTFGASNTTTTNYTFNIDNQGPYIEIETCSPANVNPPVNVTCNATITDISGVGNVLANVTYPNGTNQTQSVLSSGDVYNFTFETLGTGTLTITWLANDSIGNEAINTTTYTVGTPPNVTIITPLGESYPDGTVITIVLDVSDEDGVDNITGNVTAPNGTVTIIPSGNQDAQFTTDTPSDTFDTDTIGINWEISGEIDPSQNCTAEIDGSIPDTASATVDGKATLHSVTYCGIGSIRPLEGDFNVTVPFGTAGPVALDSGFALTFSEKPELNFSNKQIIFAIGNFTGAGAIIDTYVNEGNGTQLAARTNLTAISDGIGRVQRINNTFYGQLWNGSEFVTTNVATANITQALHVQLGILSVAPNFGNLTAFASNITIESENRTFAHYETTEDPGQYNISIFANDTFGAINDTETTNFTIFEFNEPPNTPLVIIPSAASINKGTINITWVAVDDDENDTLEFNITLLNPDQTFNSSIATQLLNIPFPRRRYEWDTTTVTDGTYHLQISAYENETADGKIGIDLTNNVFSIDNTPPQLANLSPADSSTVSLATPSSITADIFDAIAGADSAIISLTYPNSTTINITATVSSGTLNASFIPTLAGNYTYNIFANDTVGNSNTTQNITFTAQDVAAPSVIPANPIAGTTYFVNQAPILVSAGIKDATGIDTVNITIITPNGSVTTQTTNVSPYEPDESTIVLLHLDEAAGDPTDSSGNTFNITALGTSAPNTSGVFFASRTFTNGVINVTDNGVLNFDENESFTVELWVNATDTGGEHDLINKYDSTNLSVQGWRLHIHDDGTPSFENLHTNGTIFEAESTTNIIDNTFHHIAGVRNAQQERCLIYIDGTLESNASCPSFDLTNSENLSIGNDDDLTRPFVGTMDEVRISSSARTTFSPDYYPIGWSDFMQRGQYNISYFANDTLGQTNNTETTHFIREVLGGKLVDVINLNNSYHDYTTTVITNASGTINVNITLSASEAQSIIVNQHDELSPYSVLRIQNTSEQHYAQAFIIDPADLNFSSLNITFTSQGYYLHKCTSINTSTNQCDHIGNYSLIGLELTPGQNYTLNLTPEDPIITTTVQGNVNTSDSYLDEQKSGTNRGAQSIIEVGTFNKPSRRNRGIIKFNLTGITPGVTVLEANLSLYFTNIPGGDTSSGTRTHQVHRVQQSPARNWSELQVTWDNYLTGTPWTSAGGDFNATPSTTQTVANAQENSFITFNVTDDVDNFINNPSINFGWIITDSSESTTRTRRQYASAQASAASERPRLDIVYFDPPPNVTNVQPLNSTAFSRQANVTIAAQVVDNTAVDTVLANITHNGITETITLTFDNVTNRYEGFFDNTTNVDQYNVTIFANDTVGGINASEGTTFFVQVANINISKTGPANVTRGDTYRYNITYTVEQQSGIPPLSFTSSFDWLTNDTLDQFSPQMLVTSTDTVLITYHETDGGGDDDVYILRSTDDGATFGSPIAVADEAGFDENYPNIAEFQGVTYIVYTRDNGSQTDIYIRNSTDDGVTWNAAIQVTDTTYSEDEPSLEFHNHPNPHFMVFYSATIPPDTDVELYLVNSTDTFLWSSPLQLTNNSYNDYDPDVLQVDDDTYLVWAPENPTLQEIWFANFTSAHKQAPGIADLVKKQITSNSFYDFEPSVQQDAFGVAYVAWVTLINVSEVGNPDPGRTSNEIFVARSLDRFDNFVINRITDDTTSDTYPAMIQQGASGLFFLAWLRANTSDMDIIFAKRDCVGGDARSVFVNDTVSSDIELVNGSITDGGEYNDTSRIINWSRSVQYQTETTDLFFNFTVDTNLSLGTNISNIVTINWSDCGDVFVNETNVTGVPNATVVNEPPDVFPDREDEVQEYFLNATVNISANMTDFEPVDISFANVTLPNGTVLTFNLTNITDIYSLNFTNLSLRGQYNITFFGNDTLGAPNFSETTFFTRESLNFVDIINLSDFQYLNYTVTVIDNVSNLLNVSANISQKRVQGVNITLHNLQSPFSILRIDDEFPTNRTPPGTFVQYGIDPEGINFTSMEVIVNATGNEYVWKCEQYNITERDCFPGEWVPIAPIEPGENYNFTIGPTDPGFLETSVAADVALTPLNETAFIIVFVNASAGQISFRVINTSGTVLMDGTPTAADNTSRVSVDILNTTHFVASWIDGTTNSLEAALVNIDGTVDIGPSTLDSTVGTSTDVSVQMIDFEQTIHCYANDADNDADFQITNSTPPGAIIVGETSVDGNIAPGAPLQNLIECAGNTNTLFTYFWFDDFIANDATYAIVDSTGTTLFGPTDIDTNVGETAQVAATDLNNNATALLWYDSADDDVTFAVINLSGSTLTGPTDIDTDVGVLSRVSIATAREDENATEDLFVAVYSDANDIQIEAAVYYANGTELTAPFAITTDPNVTALLHDVTARDTITNQSLCPGRFVVAFSNSTGSGEFLGFFLNGTPWNGTCDIGQTDLLPLNVTFNVSNPGENETIDISSTILNNGTAAASSILVRFFDGECGTGTQINGDQNIASLAPGDNETVNVTYLANPVGPHNISVCVDPLDSISESNEDNNNLTQQLNVSAYHDFFGELTGNVTLDNDINQTEYDWVFADQGNVYFADADANVDFSALQALGRNASGAASTSDFLEADQVIGMTGFNDSIQTLWATDASTPKTTQTFIVRERTILNVPIINSSNTSNFVTGILWDTSDDVVDQEFDSTDAEDLVFVANVNRDQAGGFGTYDYEAHVPVLLRDINLSTNNLAFYVELR